MRVEIDLLGGFAVRVDGRAVAPEGGGAARPRRGSNSSRWPRAGRCTASRSSTRCGPAPRSTRRRPGCTRPRTCTAPLGDPRALVLAGDTVSLFPDADVVVDADAFGAAPGRLSQPRRDGDGVVRPRLCGRPVDRGPAARGPVRGMAGRPARSIAPAAPGGAAPRGPVGDLALADPADEDASLALARQLADSGDRRGALRQLERLERHCAASSVSPQDRPSPRCAPSCLPRTRPQTGGVGTSPLGRDAELAASTGLIAAASAGQGRTLFVSGPRASVRPPCCAGWTGGPRSAGSASASARPPRIEGAWPFAPVLEALADLCRRHPALLDGLADQYRVEIEGALRGTAGLVRREPAPAAVRQRCRTVAARCLQRRCSDRRRRCARGGRSESAPAALPVPAPRSGSAS